MSDVLVEKLLARIAELRAAGPARTRLLIGIAGAPGVGKSTLAEALVAGLAREPWQTSPVAHVPMDGFHLADAALDLLGLRDRKGAPETFDAEGYAALLERIAAGEEVWAPAFERELEQPIAQSIPVPAAARIVISEGNYLLLSAPPWPRVRALFDEVWFCELDDDVRRARLIDRHVRFGKTPEQARAWVLRSDEANAALVAAAADSADLRLDLSELGGG
ncbi:MAG TPA: nucleoside/nucleotide kinase family protein [Jatrophihabitans sp.]|nr:nucleoside/nucleotide kinase family protein [Jatrophihabitans sp.]